MSVPSFFRIIRGSDGVHGLKFNKGFFLLKNFNVSRYAAPIPALVPASRYNCDVKLSYVNACAKFHSN